MQHSEYHWRKKCEARKEKEKGKETNAYAPLYCATSSPRRNTFGLLSISSDMASFKASRTVTSLVELSVAYVRRRRIEGLQADRWNAGCRDAEEIRGESRRAAGRKSRGAAILGDGLRAGGSARSGEGRIQDKIKKKRLTLTRILVEDDNREEKKPFPPSLSVRRGVYYYSLGMRVSMAFLLSLLGYD